MIDNENKLLEQADLWFTLEYEESPTQYGLFCRKIWNKPLPHKKLQEVVYGPSEKEVDAFIKAQKLIRWIDNALTYLIPLLTFVILYCQLFVNNLSGAYILLGFFFVFVLMCLFLVSYVKPLEKSYEGKIITHIL